jgi:hypothetical protein
MLAKKMIGCLCFLFRLRSQYIYYQLGSHHHVLGHTSVYLSLKQIKIFLNFYRFISMSFEFETHLIWDYGYDSYPNPKPIFFSSHI